MKSEQIPERRFKQMLDFILTGIIVMAIFYMVKRASEKESVKQQNKDEFIVRLPKLYTWIGAICATLFFAIFIMMIIYPDETSNFWIGAGFLSFVLAGGFFTNASLAWRIRVNINHDYFLYRTIFWRSIQIRYAEIEKVRTSRSVMILTYQHKKLMIDRTAYHTDLFYSIVKQHRSHTSGKE